MHNTSELSLSIIFFIFFFFFVKQMITSGGNIRRLPAVDRNIKANKLSLLLLSVVAARHAVAPLRCRPVCIHSDVKEQTARTNTHAQTDKVQMNRNGFRLPDQLQRSCVSTRLKMCCFCFALFLPFLHRFKMCHVLKVISSFKGTVHRFSPLWESYWMHKLHENGLRR